MESRLIKQEPIDDNIPNFPPIELETPAGFESEEWVKVTEGFASEEQEVHFVISQRGQTGSRKGRPTNSTVQFKGTHSNSERAIQQRDRAAMRSMEEKAIDNARSSDRGAKTNLKKKLEKDPNYISLPEAKRMEIFESKLEAIWDKRLKEQQSALWLEQRLRAVHLKWEKIDHEISIRQHQQVMAKLSGKTESKSETMSSRAEERLYGSGGILEKIMRDTYNRGFQKLQSNTFENKAEKEEWQAWVKDLTPEELAMVTNQEWQQREPESFLNNIPDGDDKLLEGHMPYVLGNESDECEEEVDNDSELDEMFNTAPNEYELDSLSEDSEGSEKTDFEGFSDDSGETDFEGFSDYEE